MQTAHKTPNSHSRTREPRNAQVQKAGKLPRPNLRKSLSGAVVTRCYGIGGATELWQVRYCTTGSKGQLWGRGLRLTALVHGWRSCCLWAFLDRQVVGGTQGQRGMGSSSRVDVSAPSILGYTGSDSITQAGWTKCNGSPGLPRRQVVDLGPLQDATLQTHRLGRRFCRVSSFSLGVGNWFPS